MATRGIGLAALLMENSGGATFTPFANSIAGLNARAYINQGVMRMPPQLENGRVQIAAAPIEEAPAAVVRATAAVQQEVASKPVSTALVTVDSKPSKTADVEPKKSLFQTLTQRKVLIAAGVVLGAVAIGGAAAAAYYFYPVATAAHAVTVGSAGRAAAMNTHQLFIRPGFANTMFMAKLAMQAAVIPAAKITLPLLLPVISTAIVSTLGTLVLLYIGNRIWIAAKAAMWGAGTAVAKGFGNELDKTYVGMAAKAIVVTTVSPFVTPFMAPEKAEVTSGAPVEADMPALEDGEAAEVVQARLQLEAPAEQSKSKKVDEAEAERIAALRAAKNKKAKECLAARQAQAQMKTQGTWLGAIVKAGLITAGLGAGVYVASKYQTDIDFINGL